MGPLTKSDRGADVCQRARKGLRQINRKATAWRNLSKFAKTLQKGQLVTLEDILRYREVEDDVKGTTFKHRIAEVHATSMKRLSKIEATDDPLDEAGDE
jgi:single-strand DNA-binding protein